MYFSNKQSSPEKNSQKLDLSINEENNTIAQLQSNQQISLNTSKETEISDTLKNNVNGKQMYILVCKLNSFNLIKRLIS